ncbi:MAG: hypothetical protein HC915_14405 [Anaerolineae bacterium]|nr:hypothetical protein [Anaerolineae bacterium]
MHNPDADPDPGVVLNTITWTLNPISETEPDPWTFEDGCFTLNYEVSFPDTDFALDDPITNTVTVTSAVDTDNDPFDGVCPVPNCVGTGGTSNDIDPPTVEVDGNKSGPGTNAVVGLGTEDGTSTFSLNWNLDQANVPTSNFVVEDIFPLAVVGSPVPIIEMTELNTGTWEGDGAYTAVLEYTTSTSDPRTWLPVGNPPPGSLDGIASQTFTLADGDFPADVAGIRLVFTTDVPAGFRPMRLLACASSCGMGWTRTTTPRHRTPSAITRTAWPSAAPSLMCLATQRTSRCPPRNPAPPCGWAMTQPMVSSTSAPARRWSQRRPSRCKTSPLPWTWT